ncbi:hypothetical protein FACS189447_01670 [Spirochaetia bacterium]|nr:hypothetical protein FACS189447_01670 [Spirochaetia bacterium]
MGRPASREAKTASIAGSKKIWRVPLGIPEGKEIMKANTENKISEKVRRLIVSVGHGLYRASVSVKDFGERSRIDPIIWFGKAGRRFAMNFPIK